MVLSFHSLILKTPDRLLIVDTCIGNQKERAYPRWNQLQSSFLSDLDDAGFKTREFDTVLCTHMHVDHVGWNTFRDDTSWRATFPNARYLFGKTEWHHWQREDQTEFGPVIEDSVQPIFDLGLADLVDSDYRVCDEVRLIPTPGHTPGHVSILIESQGEAALITGDTFHHPCQIAHPNLSTTVDSDMGKAIESRMSLLDNYADQPVLCIGTHFAGVTAGRIVRDRDSFRLDY